MSESPSTGAGHPTHNARLQNISVFANPIAGRGQGRKIATTLVARLRREGFSATPIFDPPSQIAAQAIRHNDVAVVIGGDGTLRAVADRYYTEIGAVPPLLPVPMGTANLMGRHLGIQWDSSDLAARVAESILRGKLRRFDAAKANNELFLLVAGIGIDAFIVHVLDRLRNGPIHYLSYLVPAALAWTTYEYTPLKVWVDGVLAFDWAPALAYIGNVSEYGTGFPLLPEANPEDGLLDICVIPARSRGHVIKQFLRAAAGEHLLAEGVVHLRGKSVDIHSPVPVPMQVDGDPAGHTPVHIDLLPVRVPFIVPV